MVGITGRSEEVIERKQKAKDNFRKAYEDLVRMTGKTNQQISHELGIPLGTINDTLSKSNKTLSADLVASFCAKYRTTDLNYIYLGEIDGPQKYVNENNYSIMHHSADCHPLSDESFMGTFYGYCRNTQNYNHIDNFTLTIKMTTKMNVQAELILNTCNQKLESTQKILYGTPMHLEPNIIYIIFQSEKGDDMFVLSYNYFKINSGKKLYCRYGSLMTPCRSTNRYPQLQSFLLLDKPILPENMHYIDGFLNLTQDKIIVPAHLYDSETDGLMAKDDNVKAFFTKCKDMHYNKEDYYCFSEKVLLALGEANDIDYDVTAATIMTLKKNSINPKVVDFPNNKTYSKFFASLTENK